MRAVTLTLPSLAQTGNWCLHHMPMLTTLDVPALAQNRRPQNVQSCRVMPRPRKPNPSTLRSRAAKPAAATPLSLAERVARSRAKAVQSGGRRLPNSILPPDATRAAAALLAAGYAPSFSACIARALLAAATNLAAPTATTFASGLTPELSRAAKRRRLERTVSSSPARSPHERTADQDQEGALR